MKTSFADVLHPMTAERLRSPHHNARTPFLRPHSSGRFPRELASHAALVLTSTLLLGHAAFAADTTPPLAPGQPTEGSPDTDYDADGTYTLSWPAASDAQSGIRAYTVQEKIGPQGSWKTLTTTQRTPRLPIRGRLDKTRYVYRVQAKNGAGLPSAWSPESDGVLIDRTAPIPVTVTDDGVTTFSTTTLHATWSISSDPESGIAQYEYLIRRDSTAGTIIVNWTSVGLATEVTRDGLSLASGKKYFFGVRAKNGAGRYSSIRYSDGIMVQPDSTPPTAPGQPAEGSPDVDYDGDGAYAIEWPAATDAESGINAYDLQEKEGASGEWQSLPGPIAATSFSVTGRRHATQYFYRVRATNGADLPGPWSNPSDGLTVDATPALAPATVTDDGSYTTSTTQLHVTWEAATDAESGVTDYQYQVREGSATGTLLRDWTSVGLVTEVMATDLTLTRGTSYYVGVRAMNGAGWEGTAAYTDGLTIDPTPPSGSALINEGAAYTTTPTVMLTLEAHDEDGTSVTRMRFSHDDTQYTDPEAYATTKAWTLTDGDGEKAVYVQFENAAPLWSASARDTIALDTHAPHVTIEEPDDGSSIGRD
ncbi:MAG: fibronectin type III domain-containing protein [Candidatus Omnitrophota bacterium]|nr:fibronectin type III domain-containing protein [Candidatus Omnitrophota bacterium]